LEKASLILLYHIDLFTQRFLKKYNQQMIVNETRKKILSSSSSLPSQQLEELENISFKEYFAVHVSKGYFVELCALLKMCLEHYKQRPTSMLFKYAIITLLRSLRLNIHHLLQSRVNLKDYKMSSGTHLKVIVIIVSFSFFFLFLFLSPSPSFSSEYNSFLLLMSVIFSHHFVWFW
jgi:hypothetical protein